MSLISPTQVGLWNGCNRKFGFQWWGADYFPGLTKEPRGDSLLLGTEMHGCSENYLRDGKAPDRLTLAGEMFISGLQFLPPPSPDNITRIEHEFVLKLGGNTFSGSMDYYGPIPGVGDRIVLDHKTSKNPEAYGLWQPHTTGQGYSERKGWLDDPQVLIYSAYDMVASGDSKSTLRWCYYNVPSKRSKRIYAVPSDFTVTRAEVEDNFGRLVHPSACAISSAKEAKPHPNELDANYDFCESFGRKCWYADKGCIQQSKTERVFSVRVVKPAPQKENGRMEIDLISMVKNFNSSAAAAKASPAPAAPAGATATVADKINPPEAVAAAPASIAPKKAEPKAGGGAGTLSEPATTGRAGGAAKKAEAVETPAEIVTSRVAASDDAYETRERLFAFVQAAIALGAGAQAEAALRGVLKAAL